eukprot:14248619-Ditylum_brightwellii.AAC.1
MEAESKTKENLAYLMKKLKPNVLFLSQATDEDGKFMAKVLYGKIFKVIIPLKDIPRLILSGPNMKPICSGDEVLPQRSITSEQMLVNHATANKTNYLFDTQNKPSHHIQLYKSNTAAFPSIKFGENCCDFHFIDSRREEVSHGNKSTKRPKQKTHAILSKRNFTHTNSEGGFFHLAFCAVKLCAKHVYVTAQSCERQATETTSWPSCKVAVMEGSPYNVLQGTHIKCQYVHWYEKKQKCCKDNDVEAVKMKDVDTVVMSTGHDYLSISILSGTTAQYQIHSVT